ncbi:hypothetical protein MSAN_01905300 [Mycena sanguinolenta]|uniref:Uncharacterized protein n=1 Tax=Mycena sanguinolenta TaxID=230812 RepID=A0A8H6XRJ2_9AGAR|nr:hypothetical protein MSAN_01905300 [Mycena sanguinolenta]
MFFKHALCCLGTLALVRAAPSLQKPMSLSQTDATPVAGLPGDAMELLPGMYMIFNANPAAQHVHLRAFTSDTPLYVSHPLDTYGQWMVEPQEDSLSGKEYRITNVGLNASIYVSEDNLFTGNINDSSDRFSIEPAEGGAFLIRSSGPSSKVWTLADPAVPKATVQLRALKTCDSELWRFVPTG